MKKILLIYPPFCTPVSPPYSITSLYGFLKNNSNHNIKVLDLNLEFHKLKFPEYQKYYQDKDNWDDYQDRSNEFIQLTKKVYSNSNNNVVNGKHPELFQEMLKKIKDKKPDIVAFSAVYSSQVFYAYSLIKELKDVKCVVGGPAVNDKLKTVADATLNNEIELLEYIKKEKPDHNKLNFSNVLDYSIYDLDEYFTPKTVLSLKTSTSCYYKKCTFCAHYNDAKYFEFSLDDIKKTIVRSKKKYFFLIDDMIHVKRLLNLAEIFKPLNIGWACQLKPTKEFSLDVLKTLRESGLSMILWGIESANDRVLGMIKKGTNKKDIENVLQNSHNAGIKNIAYILFGFPTETKQEFLETIDLLKKNDKNIDLVSTSIFGLQKNTAVYDNPEMFGITKIYEGERTILDHKLSYDVKEGLSNKEAMKLRRGYKRTIEKINKYPKSMNFFREHMMVE